MEQINEIYGQYKKKLEELISFKTVSAFASSAGEMEKSCNWYENLFKEQGFRVQIIKEYDNPIIFAEYHVSDDLETCLIYGHYDVQPAEEKDWKSDPFTLTETENKLLARGVVDNKGQTFIHIATIINLIKENKLKYNIKFIIEGGEETGSPNVERFIIDHKDMFHADFIMISDGSLVNGAPVIEAGLRGILNLRIELLTSKKDIHSGMYGTTAPNAIHELTKLVSKFYDSENRIIIPGFYDDVTEIEKTQKEKLLNLKFDINDYYNETGTRAMLNEPGENLYTQTGTRPTIQITGIYGGHTGEGIKTIIPGYAAAKVNIRLVDAQNPEDILNKIKTFIENNIPEYVDYNIISKEMVGAVKINLNNKFVKEAERLIQEVYNSQAVEYYIGGTIPIVKYFKDYLDKPILSIPLGSEDNNMHGANENFKVADIKKGIEFSIRFFS